MPTNLTKSQILENTKKMRLEAPKPFGLYSATCIGLDGGLAAYTQNFQDTNFTDFSAGLKVYRNSEYLPKRTKSKVIKQDGRVKLLEYATKGDPILLVPSLVNRHYVFDLYEDNSLIQHLIKEGKRPFVIDWGAPTTAEEGFGLYEAIEDYVLEFSRYLTDYTNSQIHLLGYCMGATFALIAASLRPKHYKTLTLVALPYDFRHMPFTGMLKAYKDYYKVYFKNQNVSADLIQTMFYMLDPKAVIGRIQSFAKVKDDSQLRRMIALEDWLTDCADVDAKVANDIIQLWYDENKIYYKEINFDNLSMPIILVTATKDVIVPNDASVSVISKVKNITHIEVESGHIGIIIGRNSKDQFYQKLTNKLL